MIMNRLLKKLIATFIVLCGIIVLSSCKAGLTYEEAPESVYSEVGVSGFTLRARELFENKIFAVNWDKWVDNYINTQSVATYSGTTWKNETGAAYTLPDGTVVEAGSSVTLKGKMTEENNEKAPDGKLYVLTFYSLSRATYSTPNKGYLFDGSKFSGDYVLVDPLNNRSQEVNLPVRKNELIGELNLNNSYDCVVEPIDGSAVLGQPGDFTKSNFYLVKNIAYLPAGVEQYKRLYEIRVVFLP